MSKATYPLKLPLSVKKAPNNRAALPVVGEPASPSDGWGARALPNPFPLPWWMATIMRVCNVTVVALLFGLCADLATSVVLAQPLSSGPSSGGEERVQLVISKLPPPTSKGKDSKPSALQVRESIRNAIKSRAGDATSRALTLTNSESWSVAKDKVEAVKQAAAERGLVVTEVDTDMHHVFQLDVASAYYDAALADRLVDIADSSLVQTGEALRQTTLARQVGNQSEFDLLRARDDRARVADVRVDIADGTAWRGLQ